MTELSPGLTSTMHPFAPAERERQMLANRLPPPAEVATAITFAAGRSPGVDVVTLRIEPLDQKIYRGEDDGPR